MKGKRHTTEQRIRILREAAKQLDARPPKKLMKPRENAVNRTNPTMKAAMSSNTATTFFSLRKEVPW